MFLLDNVKNRKMNSIQNFKHKKFDFGKYVKNFYVEDGIAYISCNISSIDEIISHYSIKDYEWLNSEFANYIETNAYYIPIEYPITIEICGANFSAEERVLISEVIKDYFGLKLGDKQIDVEINMRKSIVLLLLGILSFIIVFFLGKFGIIDAFMEWGLILFWFFIWEFIEVFILDRNTAQIARLEAAQLASVKVVFSDILFKEVIPKQEVTEQEALNEIFGDEETKEKEQ